MTPPAARTRATLAASATLFLGALCFAAPPPAQAVTSPARTAGASTARASTAVSSAAASSTARAGATGASTTGPSRHPTPFALSVGSANGQPVTGHLYRFYVNVTSVDVPGANIALQIWFTPGLTLATPPPPGCFPAPGGLDCGFGVLSVGQTLTLALTVTVAKGLPAGTQVGVSALLRYDWLWWGYASVSRPVTVPPPPPPPPPPPSSPPPSSAPPPPRHHHHPRPAALPPQPTPASPTPTPSHPPAHRPHKRRPHPRPSLHTYRALAIRPQTPPSRPPKPLIPLGILLTVVVTPCVAAAITRFGKTARGPR